MYQAVTGIASCHVIQRAGKRDFTLTYQMYFFCGLYSSAEPRYSGSIYFWISKGTRNMVLKGGVTTNRFFKPYLANSLLLLCFDQLFNLMMPLPRPS